MPRLLGLCSVLIAGLLAITPARADVSWDFIVTSAANLTFPSDPLDPRPALGGTLTVSDAAFLRGSLDYSYGEIDNRTEPVTPGDVTGDTDFDLEIGLLPLPIDPSLLENGSFYVGFYYAYVGLSFSPNGKISGIIDFLSFNDDVEMGIINNVVTNARYGSDGTIPGCGFMTYCSISGHWKLTSGHPLPHRVPEPSALSLLVGAITGLGILRRRVVLPRLRIA